MHYACRCYRTPVAKITIQAGADVDESYGYSTPLMHVYVCAVMEGYGEDAHQSGRKCELV
jgi:hypothetical protein